MDMLEAVARRGLAEIEHRLDRLYAASHFSGPVGTLGVVASLQRTDTTERLDRYEARLRASPPTSTRGPTWRATASRPV